MAVSVPRAYLSVFCLALVAFLLFLLQSIILTSFPSTPVHVLPAAPHSVLATESSFTPTSTPESPAHPTPSLPQSKDYHDWNAQTLRDLDTCLAANTCGPNQRKVALLASYWMVDAITGDFRGGEGIWSISVYDGLRALGYTILLSRDFDEALAQYRTIPDLVKVVIRNHPANCHLSPTCVKGPANPTGIPAWKIFDFQFFPDPHADQYQASKLGGKWILSANPEPGEERGEEGEGVVQYIGYSIEDTCLPIPVVPYAQRAYPPRAWLLMKQLAYLHTADTAWEHTTFARAARELGGDHPTAYPDTAPNGDAGFVFAGAWSIDQTWLPHIRLNSSAAMVDIAEEGVVINLGRSADGDRDRDGDGAQGGTLPQAEFVRALGTSRVLVGVGAPWWSPSPYNALCAGVPFLNPIIHWAEDGPWDRKRWHSQHPSLARYDPPYVYNVHARNFTGFVEALRAASTTEIGRFIPAHMTNAAVRARLVGLMETDWRAAAAVLLEQRMEQREAGDASAYIFEL